MLSLSFIIMYTLIKKQLLLNCFRRGVLKMKDQYSYEIFMDTSGDIDAAFARENGIRFIGMNYTISGEERFCAGMESEEILKKFYDGQRNGDLTRTSQITPHQYAETFAPVLKEGKSVLYICLSSGLSNTFESVRLAAAGLKEEYPEQEVCPVDSLAATGGMGLITERAVKNRAAGMSVSENAEDLQRTAVNACHVFMVDDLGYLRRGGRVSAATAVVGTMLNVKPVLIINGEGKLPTIGKKRGDRQAIKMMLDRFLESRDPSASSIYITHGDCADKADYVAQQVREKVPDADIHIMMLSPVIGAHTGPGMVSLIYWGDRSRIE